MLMFYAMTGGVPRYMELLTSSGCSDVESFKKFLFSQASSWYRQDGYVILGNEFRMESSAYFSLLRAIAYGKTQWSELQNEVSTNLAPYMSRLETQFNLLKKNYPFGKESSGRGTRYLLTDEYFRFWFKFIEPMTFASLYESSQWKLSEGLFDKAWPDFCGRTLENWFLKDYSESGEWTAVGQWWDKKGENEIDLIAVNELEDKIQFAEIKRNPKKICLEKLKEKAEVFIRNNSRYKNFDISFNSLSLVNFIKF
jgi:Holliday junction resolvase-like predicted endonuclease